MPIHMHVRRLAPISAAGSIMFLLGSGCSAQTNQKLACSSSDVVATAEALLLKDFRSGSNEAVETILDTAHTTMSFEAIRTVESGPRRSLCQASLRVKLAYAANPLGKAVEAEAKKKGGDNLAEEQYQVQLTDDGGVYVTILDPKRKIQGVISQSPSDQDGDE